MILYLKNICECEPEILWDHWLHPDFFRTNKPSLLGPKLNFFQFILIVSGVGSAQYERLLGVYKSLAAH